MNTIDLENESFSATVLVCLLELLGMQADESLPPLDYFGAGEGPSPNLEINAEKYLGLKPWGPGEGPGGTKILVDTGPLLPAANKKDPASGMATTFHWKCSASHGSRHGDGRGADHLYPGDVLGDDAARRFMKTLVGGAHEIAFMTRRARRA